MTAFGQHSITDLPGKEGDGGGAKKPPPPKPTDAARERSDRDLKKRLEDIFERMAEAADARDDDELAEVIREDGRIMAQGLVSLTRPLRALRAPLVGLLSIAEPVMAFSRLGRLMFGRWYERRSAPVDPPDTPAEQ